MSLDPATLGAAFVLLSGVLGVLLLFSWVVNRNVVALAWWGAAYCLVPFGMGLVSLGQKPPGALTLLISNSLMLQAYGLLYAGCRAFNGRKGQALPSLYGPVLWLAIFAAIHDSHAARLIAASTIAGTYTSLAAWELWRHAPQRLVSQRVAVVLLVLLATFNGLRLFLGLASATGTWMDILMLRWSADMAILLLLFIPALAFVFLSMAKEHVEYEYKQAALVDPLTGIPNRRAFLQNAGNLLERFAGRPVSCLLFDLDNFKKINDSYGHETGDRILTIFGAVLAEKLPDGSFGRMGGEEFAALVPLDSGEAEALADTIRQSFATVAGTVLGQPVAATVSIGCATAVEATMPWLLHEADEALYRAKAGGRNTVAMAGPEAKSRRVFRYAS